MKVSEEPSVAEWVREGSNNQQRRYLTHGTVNVGPNAYGSWSWWVDTPKHHSSASGVEPTQQRAKALAMLIYLTLTHQAVT